MWSKKEFKVIRDADRGKCCNENLIWLRLSCSVTGGDKFTSIRTIVCSLFLNHLKYKKTVFLKMVTFFFPCSTSDVHDTSSHHKKISFSDIYCQTSNYISRSRTESPFFPTVCSNSCTLRHISSPFVDLNVVDFFEVYEAVLRLCLVPGELSSSQSLSPALAVPLLQKRENNWLWLAAWRHNPTLSCGYSLTVSETRH